MLVRKIFVNAQEIMDSKHACLHADSKKVEADGYIDLNNIWYVTYLDKAKCLLLY